MFIWLGRWLVWSLPGFAKYLDYQHFSQNWSKLKERSHTEEEILSTPSSGLLLFSLYETTYSEHAENHQYPFLGIFRYLFSKALWFMKNPCYMWHWKSDQSFSEVHCGCLFHLIVLMERSQIINKLMVAICHDNVSSLCLWGTVGIYNVQAHITQYELKHFWKWQVLVLCLHPFLIMYNRLPLIHLAKFGKSINWP